MTPNTEFFLVRIFSYLDLIREITDQKKIRIWILFTQCIAQSVQFKISASSITYSDVVNEFDQ